MRFVKRKHIIDYLIFNAENQKGLIKLMSRKGEYKEYSHKEILRVSKKYANYFSSLGITEGSVVSIMLPTSLDLIGAFFGAQLIKAVPTFLYPPMNLSNVDAWLEKTNKMMNRVNSMQLITDDVINSVIKIGKKSSYNFEVALTKNVSDFSDDFIELDHYENESLCFLQFSSGTTGEPKAVQITQENVIENIKAMYKEFDVSSGEFNGVSWLPLYHDMGLVGCLLGNIIYGSTATLIRPDDFIRKPYLWLKAISDQKANMTVAPNFAYGLCVKRIPVELSKKIDLSSLEIALCGAEFVHESTMKDFINRFSCNNLKKSVLTPVYGMAEATLGVTFSSMKNDIKFKIFNSQLMSQSVAEVSKEGTKICSVGKPLQDMSVLIKDSNDKILPEMRIGEVFVSGPSVTSGYFNDQYKTQTILKNGELKTGDIGFIHEGELYICGRAKETIIIRGKNYYPTSYEEKIFCIPGVREGRVIVTSKPCEKSGTEELIVLCEVKSKKILDQKSDFILNEIKKTFNDSGLIPKYLKLLPPGALPKTTSGKLKRSQAMYLLDDESLESTNYKNILREYLNSLLFLKEQMFLKLKSLISGKERSRI